MRRSIGLLLAVSMLLASCNPGALEAQPFEGIWESDGWGIFLLIDGGDVEFFEHTAEHCLAVGTAGARGIADSLALEGERLVLRDSDREIRFDPIDLLPTRCADADPSDDPARAVVVLAATVEEHLVGELDDGWQARRDRIVGRAESGEELFPLLVELVEPLDGRVRLAGDGRRWPPPPDLPRASGFDPLDEGPGYVVATSDGIGYLAIERTGPFDADAEESERIAGRIVDRVTGYETVVIDLRSTSGGSLTDGLLIATRFVGEPRVVASLRARAGDRTVPAGDLSVNPAPTGVHSGDVFVLVGPETRGVGELLAHVLGTLDTVTVVGAPTAGVPVPSLNRYLPNGWVVAIPNLVAIAGDGTQLGSVQPDVLADDALAGARRLAG